MNNNRIGIGGGLMLIAIHYWNETLYSILTAAVIGGGTALLITEDVRQTIRSKRIGRLVWKGEG